MHPAVRNDNHVSTMLLIVLGLFLTLITINFTMVSDYYTYFINSNDKNNTIDLDINSENSSEELKAKEEIKNVTTIKVIPKQPSCPPQDKRWQLNTLCAEFLSAKLSCRPEDINNPLKHKIPKYYYQHSLKNNSNSDTQNTIVNCIIAILLLTSLGAALLEFYRAKISPTPEGGKKGAKVPLNRKCSLADLTVLKHHRKELVRRESILEHHLEEQGEGSLHQGPKPSPLYRRCSFPVTLPSNDTSLAGGGGGFPGRRNSRKMSMMGCDSIRRVSIVNEGGRKLSIMSDEAIWRRGSVVGEDTSPDRRVHHSRLVHRH